MDHGRIPRRELANLRSTWRTFSGVFVRDIVRIRYPILMLSTLTLGPMVLLDRTGLRSLVGNALLVDTYEQLALLCAVTYVAIVFAIAIFRVMASRTDADRAIALLGRGEVAWSRHLHALTVVLAAFAPAIVYWNSAEELGGLSWSWVLVSYVSGVMAGALILALVGRLKSWLVGSTASFQNYFPFENRDSPGCIPHLRSLDIVDGQLFIYTFLILCMLFIATRQAWFPLTDWISTPTVVIVIVWLAGLILSGMAYWLDGLRLPPLLLLVVMITTWRTFFPNQAHINTVEGRATTLQFGNSVARLSQAQLAAIESEDGDRVDDSATAIEETAWRAMTTRMEQLTSHANRPGKTLVVVTCPGGGIHAAAWCACVLEGFALRYEDFVDSVGILSGVSGGSVAALHFAARHYITAPADPAEDKSAFDRATESSLEAVARGLLVDDLYRTFLPLPFFSDRGQSLEDSFQQRLPTEQQRRSMGDWGELALAGTMPIVVFNVTDAKSGRRVLFDTVPTPQRASLVGNMSRPRNYRELLSDPALDVKPASAARASATFPYISPFASPTRANAYGQRAALCDGGYADNEGIVTAIDWIDFLSRRRAIQTDAAPFERILLLRIQPSEVIDSMLPPAANAWLDALRWLIGPLESMANVRSSSQNERGYLEADLASAYVKRTQLFEMRRLTAHRDAFRESWPMDREELDRRSAQPSVLKAANELRRKLTELEREADTSTAITDDRTVRSNVPALPRSLSDDMLKQPVLVREIFFLHPDPSAGIPLNWKLTKKQRGWYEQAWRAAQERDPELVSLLDTLFTVRGTGG